jgi:hypothetical protein
MKITRQDSSALVIVDFPWLMGLIVFPAALALLYAAVAAGVHHKGISQMLGFGAGGLVTVLVGSLFVKRAVFEFDLVRRELAWRRRGIFGERNGAVPLDRIRRAVVQSMNSSDGTTYRVALLTDDGDLPLTDAYSSGQSNKKRISDTINRALNIDQSDPQAAIEDEILDLARSGKKIEAIRLTRERYGYDLAKAKDFVEGLLQ